jgi:hypothetical protein
MAPAKGGCLLDIVISKQIEAGRALLRVGRFFSSYASKGAMVLIYKKSVK